MIRYTRYALVAVILCLLYQNCSYHKVGDDHKVLPFQQGPVLSRNAVLVEDFDKIFYVNRSLFPTESAFQFEARLNETTRCEVIRVEADWFQIQCPEAGTLKIIVFSIDAQDFSVIQEESTFEVLSKDQVTFVITEQRLFPLGRDIPDTTFHPNEDPNENNLNGVELYNSYCLRCHGVISNSTVDGRTFSAFQNSLEQISQMRDASDLQTLSEEQINAIMQALN